MGYLRDVVDELPNNLAGASAVAVTVGASSAIIRYLSPKYPSITEDLPKSKGWKQDAKFGFFAGNLALSYVLAVDGLRYANRRWKRD